MYERMRHDPSDRLMSRNECSRLSLPISRRDVLQSGFWWKFKASADVAEGPNRLSLAGLGNEKKDSKGTTPDARRIGFLEYGTFFDCVFFVRNRSGLVMLVFPYCNSVCGFESVFIGQRAIFVQK